MCVYYICDVAAFSANEQRRRARIFFFFTRAMVVLNICELHRILGSTETKLLSVAKLRIGTTSHISEPKDMTKTLLSLSLRARPQRRQRRQSANDFT